MRSRSVIAVVFLVGLNCSIAFSQTPARPNVNTVVSAAAAQRNVYIDEFKNLLSEETRISESYSKNGEPKNRRTVTSTFVVYQSSKEPSAVTEYRIVIAVDNKKLGDADKRAQDFFEEIQNVESSQKELEKIEKEGARFDEDISLNLFTLYQAVSLADNLRPYFEFKLEGTEILGQTELLVLSYRQVKASPYILASAKNLFTDGKLTIVYDVGRSGDINPRLRGKFWIDPQSSQIWKEVRELTIQPEGYAAPVLHAQTTFEYQQSTFGILTPRKIVYTEFGSAKKDPEPRKLQSVTFIYDKFTKPDVEVKSADVKN